MKIKHVGGPPAKVEKIELLTKKDVPEYERTRYKLVKVLEKLGGYEPAIDDIFIDQIARTAIQAKNAEVFLDSKHSTADTYSVVSDSKLKLMKIIENLTRELALSRRERLGTQTQSDIMEQIKQALEEAQKHGGQ
jgi:ATP-dependent Lon protease